MKKIMLILLLFAFTFPVVGQEIDSVKTIKNQLINLDVHLFGLGLTIHKPINDKYTFTYGIQGGFILNYFPLFYEKRYGEYQLERSAGYYESLGFNIGITNHVSEKWNYSGLIKLGISYAMFFMDISPFVGVSFQVFYKISANSSLGANVDIGVIKIEESILSAISTSFITYRIKIGN